MVGTVLQHVGVGEQQERDLAHAVIDRGRRAGDAARRRAAAGVDLLAESDLEPQHVGRGLRPERIGGAGAGQARHHQAVDLVLVDAGLVEQLFENLAGKHPDVAVALLHHLGFGVGHNRVVTQSSLLTPYGAPCGGVGCRCARLTQSGMRTRGAVLSRNWCSRAIDSGLRVYSATMRSKNRPSS